MKHFLITTLLFSNFIARTQFYQPTDQDRKLLTTNFQVILNNIPTKFEKLKTGEEYVDAGQRVTWYKSKTTLFPNSPLQNNEHLSYGSWQGKPSIAFYDRVNLEVNTIVDLLQPVLKNKAMMEVNPKNAEYDPFARAFRSKNACLMLTYNENTHTSTIVIGKIPFLYDSDVKPRTYKKPVPAPVVEKTVSSKNEKTFNEFISQEDFDNLVNVAGKREWEKWIDKSVARPAQGPIQTTLPKTGKQRNNPVVFETDGKGIYLSTMIMSTNPSEIKTIKEEIIEKIKNSNSKFLMTKGLWLRVRKYEIIQQSPNDPILFNFDKFDDNDYLQFYLFAKQMAPNQPAVVLFSIKTVLKSVGDKMIENEKNAITENTQKNDPFCIKLQKLISIVANRDYSELMPFTKPSGQANTYSFKQPYLPSFTTKTEIATIDVGKVYFSCYQEFKNNNEAFEFANKIDIQIKTCVGQKPSNLGNSVYYKIQTRNTKTNQDVNIGLSLEIIKAENSGEIPRVELRVSESYF